MQVFYRDLEMEESQSEYNTSDGEDGSGKASATAASPSSSAAATKTPRPAVTVDPSLLVTNLDAPSSEPFHISEVDDRLLKESPLSTFGVDNLTPSRAAALPRIYARVLDIEQRSGFDKTGLVPKTFAAYAIECVSASDAKRWTVWRRFSDFHALHAELAKTAYAKYIASVPPPKKALFASTKPGSAVVTARKKQLQAFLDACLLPIDLSDCIPLARFLDVESHVTKRRVRHVLLIRHGQYLSHSSNDLERTLSR